MSEVNSMQRLVVTRARGRALTIMGKIQELQDLEGEAPYGLELPGVLEAAKQELLGFYTYAGHNPQLEEGGQGE